MSQKYFLSNDDGQNLVSIYRDIKMTMGSTSGAILYYYG